MGIVLGVGQLACSKNPDDGPGGGGADASCPAAFEQVTFLATEGPSTALSIAGDVAYLSEAFSLRTIDIADPSNPSVLTHFEQATPLLYVNDLVVRDGVAFVAGGIQGLLTLDVSDPAAPRYLNTAFDGMPDGRHDALAIALVGDTAFTAEGIRGLHVYDASDAAAPRELADADFQERDHTDIAADGDRVVVNDAGRILLVDVSDPSNPAVMATYRGEDGFATESRGFWFRDDLLFFGNGASLYVLDVADPSAPVLVSNTTLPDGISSIFIEGSCLFAGNLNGAFTPVDVSDPAVPVVGAHVEEFGALETRGVVARDGWVFLASHEQGLRVYRATDAPSPP